MPGPNQELVEFLQAECSICHAINSIKALLSWTVLNNIVDASIGVDSMRQEESTASACSSVLMVYDSKFTQFSSIKFRLNTVPKCSFLKWNNNNNKKFWGHPFHSPHPLGALTNVMHLTCPLSLLLNWAWLLFNGCFKDYQYSVWQTTTSAESM